MIKIFSGIRPSGKLHLGNYLGAIKNWIELQNGADPRSAGGFGEARQVVFAVVDYHGITTPYDPKTYPRQVMDTVLDFLATGVNPDKALLIRQSYVPEHTELAWLFNTITPVSWLDRLPTYREQLEKSPKYNHMGLLDYPVLMAADILLYKSTLVPVGEDQLPHIDLTNEVAKKFNSMFPGRAGGNTFEPVKAHLTTGARIMSLQDPTKKMSKTPSTHSTIAQGGERSRTTGSGQADDSYIALSDNSDAIREKIKKAVTDSGSEIKYDEKGKPAIANLLTIYSLLETSNKRQATSIQEIEKRYAGSTSYAKFKEDLAEVIINFLKPLQEKRGKFEKDPDAVSSILQRSEEQARMLAKKTLNEVKEKMGIGIR